MLAGDDLGGGTDAVARRTGRGGAQYQSAHRKCLRSSTAQSQARMGVTPHIIGPG